MLFETMKTGQTDVAEKETTTGHATVHHCPSCGELVMALPVLRCSHCDAVHRLRGWWYSPEPGVFLAECIDLDIISEGDTAEKAISKLQEAVNGYLSVAFSGTPQGLVLRKSPRSHRMRYHMHNLAARMRARLSGKHRHFSPCYPTQTSCS